jgi:ribose 5-phosphate isomerase B
MKLAIGGDHAGFEYKQMLKKVLEALQHEVQDFGTHGPDSVDYPDFAHPVADAVESKEADLGILICGSANGVAMTANKHQGIRAAICWNKELAQLARQHNDANIICIPARFVSVELAEEMLKAFLSTSFEGGRHGKRVDKIGC